MKHKPITFLHFLVYALLLSSCVSNINSSSVPNPDDTVKNTNQADEVSTSPYYYYLKSEFHKQKGDYERAMDSLLDALKNDQKSVYLKKELITLYLRQKDSDKALKTAIDIANENPDDTNALIILAKLYQMLEKKNEAVNLYKKILKLNPDSESIYLILGRIYMDEDNYDDAFRLYSKMVGFFPDSYAAHFYLGRIHIFKKNPEYAEKEFQKTLELNPQLIEPKFELITIYQSLETEESKLNPRIITLYEEIIHIDKNNVKALLELPLYHHNHGNIEKAAQLFADLGKRSVEKQGMSMMVAKEFLGQERFKDASIIFTGMLKGVPEDSTLNYFAGIAFDSLKKSRQAIKHFLKVKPDSDNYKKTIIHVAFLYNEYDKKEKAIEFLKQKHEEFPQDIDIIMYLGSFYEEAELFDNSISILNKGISISSDKPALFFRLGIVQDKSGKKLDCIESMKKVISLDPDHASALNYLGYTYAEMGENLDEAEQLTNKALSLKPDDGFITDSLGWVYYKKGLYRQAVETLEKAVELTSYDPVITQHLGDAYIKDRQYKKALETYKKALPKITSNKEELLKKIAELETKLNEQQ